MNYFLGIDATSGRARRRLRGHRERRNHPVTGDDRRAPERLAPRGRDLRQGDDTWQLYLDGNLDARSRSAQLHAGVDERSSTPRSAPRSPRPAPPAVGFFEGSMDEVRIWNVARTGPVRAIRTPKLRPRTSGPRGTGTSRWRPSTTLSSTTRPGAHRLADRSAGVGGYTIPHGHHRPGESRAADGRHAARVHRAALRARLPGTTLALARQRPPARCPLTASDLVRRRLHR